MFYGIWFQAVARAEALWDTGSMEERFYPLCRGAIPDLGMAAVQFLSSMSKKCCVIPLDQETMEIMTEFVMMIELGFFTLTGMRYQMTMPVQVVDVEAVRAAATESRRDGG